MGHLRYALTGLFVTLVLFFNIERIDIVENNIVNIQSFVYSLAILSVMAVLAIPGFRNLRTPYTIGFWLFIYIICKFLLFRDRPAFSGVYIYLTVSEISFLAAIVYFGQLVAQALQAVEEDLSNARIIEQYRNLTFVDEAQDAIRTELTRSRHYERPVSVIVVEPETLSIDAAFTRIVQDLQKEIISRYTRNLLAKTAKEQLRLMDIVMEDRETGQLVILCPEINSDDAHILANRIREESIKKLGIIVSCGFASFPDKGLTFEGLVEAAAVSLKKNRNASIELLGLDFSDTIMNDENPVSSNAS